MFGAWILNPCRPRLWESCSYYFGKNTAGPQRGENTDMFSGTSEDSWLRVQLIIFILHTIAPFRFGIGISHVHFDLVFRVPRHCSDRYQYGE